MRCNQCGANTTNVVQNITNMVLIHLMGHTMMCRLDVPVQVLLMKVGCIAAMALKLPDAGMLFVGWILLATPLMLYNGPKVSQFLSKKLAGCSLRSVVSNVLVKVIGSVKTLLTQSASVFGKHRLTVTCLVNFQGI